MSDATEIAAMIISITHAGLTCALLDAMLQAIALKMVSLCNLFRVTEQLLGTHFCILLFEMLCLAVHSVDTSTLRARQDSPVDEV